MTAVTTSSVRPVPPSFFRRPTLAVARDLLGRYLHTLRDGQLVGGRIVEVEAYIGEDDDACHACRGRTLRNEAMYGPPGRAYVYFTYGNHWMLNVVTERQGMPAAVLIRGLEPTDGIPVMRRRRGPGRENALTNGPGKITAALGISGEQNGADLRGPDLMISGPQLRDPDIATSGRVGVSAAADIPWRFFLRGNPWVSPYRRGTRSARVPVQKRERART